MKTLLLLVFLALSPLLTRAAETNTYPPVKFPDMSGWGKNIQRTMRLLATSTAEKRNTVRILFYGQSITEQKWGLNLDGVKLLVSRASMNQSSQRMWNPCFRILEMKRLGAPVSNIEPDRASPQLRPT